MSSNKKMYPLHRFQRSAIIFNEGVLDDVIISSASWLGWKAALVYCYLRHHSYSNNVVTLTVFRGAAWGISSFKLTTTKMENSQRSKLVHFYQKKIVLKPRRWWWRCVTGDGHWLWLHWNCHGVETQEFFNFAAGASRLTNTNEPLRTSQSAILTCTWQHALSDIAGTLPWRDWTKSVWEAHTRYWFGQGDLWELRRRP